MLAGTVSYANKGRTECLKDAEVSLLRDATVVATLTTDIFGDFKFDHLDADGQKYEIEVKADGLTATKIDVTLDRSKTVGNLHLR